MDGVLDQLGEYDPTYWEIELDLQDYSICATTRSGWLSS
jgi:hypothetical protein